MNERLGQVVSTRDLIGDLTKKPFGKPTTCSECGAEAQIRTSPGGYQYYFLDCKCQLRKVYLSAKKSFDMHCETFAQALRTVEHWKNRIMNAAQEATFASAMGQLRSSYVAAVEYGYAFRLPLPEHMIKWNEEQAKTRKNAGSKS